ncbi:putative GTP cyclohydrolase [Ketogulonicigenium robustum]|uniref:Putative GTP cyclohydrolase n=1 Tax=Ketogulonicigenium robustum TaxID=92947 RepID=A0A1W6NY42_9RHOB|nr:GTP cyclohydrolase FolE2 [Ketogulonicigenium robustum]ARO14166.1 putative GTP cyclohydrolase [Ketogulonicigenium robustum]
MDQQIIPSQDDAEAALDVLRRWARRATPTEIATLDPAIARLLPGREVANYPDLSRDYPEEFIADAAYRAGMPDLQNGPASLIRGAHVPLQHVGIANFHLPLTHVLRGGAHMLLETAVTGTVSLAATHKGINMSRIMRSFYRHADSAFSFDLIDTVLADYLDDLESMDARLQLRFRLPVMRPSLRSNLQGWQYYDMSYEVIAKGESRVRIMHLDYVYASTCPCSLELSEHARQTRGQLAVPHAQRSLARLSVVVQGNLTPEDLIDLARAAVVTETQVMVKREDEQAFAELNAANPIFVEDAARLFAEGLTGDARIGDFRVLASHQESLHSHDAVAVLVSGPTFAADSLDPRTFSSLAAVSG